MAAPLKQITPADVAGFAYDPVDARALVDARAIVAAVRDQGEPALREHAARLGDVAAADAPLVVGREQLRAAFEALPERERAVLRRTAERVRAFARAQRASIGGFQQKIEGGFAGQDVREPLD